MADLTAEILFDEIMEAAPIVGELETWVERRLVDEEDGDASMLETAYARATEQLLCHETPKTGLWEHLLVVSAIRSRASTGHVGEDACRAAIEEFVSRLEAGTFKSVSDNEVVTFASALTLPLAAQRRLRQTVEWAMGRLCATFPSQVDAMADRCQDIWRRHGQMSGRDGLFVWDSRENHWRLAQDFKSRRGDD